MERLWIYAQSVVSDHRVLSASLDEAESSSRRWENEAKESVEKMARAEVERDAARLDASMARMDANAARSTRAKVESELATVQHALAVAEEARRKAEDEASRLADKQVSMLLEFRTCKDEVSAIRVEALRKAYEKGFDVIFNYGYGCCAYAHNICGSQPEVPDEMSDTSKPLSQEFFINPRCPTGTALAEAASIFVHSSEAMNALEMEALVAILKTNNSEVGENLSTAKVGPGNC